MKENGPQKIHYTIFSLLVTIVIDIMGMGLVFPLMPELFLSKNALLVSGTESLSERNILYGLAMAAWSVGIFFGSPFIGDLSDKIGRKKGILWCLGATGAAYGVAVMAVLAGSASLFIASRLAVGFFGGAFPIAQAVISDISPPDEKMKNMSWISLAASLGFVVGPLVALILSTPWIAQAGPIPIFIVAAILPLINMLWFYCLFDETYVPRKNVRLNLLKAFTAFSDVFRDPRTRFLMISIFIYEFGWGLYVQSIPMVLESQFHLTSLWISGFFIVMGLGFIAGNFVTQPQLLKFFSVRGVVIFSCLISSVVILGGALQGSLIAMVICAFIYCMFEMSSYTGFATLASNAVTKDEQGKAMGGIGVVFGAAFTMNAFLIGPIAEGHPLRVLMVVAVLMLLSGVSVHLLRNAR